MNGELTLTDMFCGAGGSSSGAIQVPGVTVKIAANHWKTAIEIHNANHQQTDHAIVANRQGVSVPSGRMETASKEQLHALRGLTHSLDETKGGLAWSLPESSFPATGRIRPRIAESAVSNSTSRPALDDLIRQHGAALAENVEPSLVENCTTRRKPKGASCSRARSAISATSPSASSVTASSSCSRSITTTSPARGAACCASGATRPLGCSGTTWGCSRARSSTSTTRPGYCSSNPKSNRRVTLSGVAA